jgi:primosomal protein N' (replication factor Y)
LEGTLTAEVAVPIPIDRTLTYVVPHHLEASLAVGTRVLVEVKNKAIMGFVVSLARDTRRPPKLKPIKEVVEPWPVLGGDLLTLGRWIADYYLSPVGEVLAAMAPPPAKPKRLYGLVRSPGALEMEIMRATSPTKAGILEALEGGKPLTAPTIRRKAGGKDCAACLRDLVSEGFLSVEVTRAARRRAAPDDPAEEPAAPFVEHRLTRDQRAALEGLTGAIAEGAFRVFLLFGVTGSGKTEVYLRAIAETIKRGRKAIYLVPEIALTPQIMERVSQRFGKKCALLHSRLSDGERAAAWLRIRSGDVDVVVGARSAVFAPLDGLGLIVVDEEHETSYKQQDSPRYNAREVAIMRAKHAGAAVILGSATPTIETYHNALAGKYQLFELPERISGGALPEVSIVDLRSSGAGYPVSEEAHRQIGQSLANREQVVLFLNRRGFSNYIQCRDCGLVPRCKNCQVTLTYHLALHGLLCHYCGYGEKGWEACPKCGGVNIEYVGSGTQKIEDYISKTFPEASCARFDRDSTRRKGSTEAVLADFASGMVRMLVGTQMLAKGHDFKGVGLVVVVNADVTMNLPDFRASERTFQIVTQVAGRAGRGDVPGRVLIQTLNPEHHALAYARGHDFKGFYAEEVGLREELRYPPFARLVRVIFEALKEAPAKQAAKDFAATAERLGKASGVRIEIMGPSRAPISRVKNTYRWHLLIKGDRRAKVSGFLRDCVKEVSAGRQEEGVRLSVDVDPQVMI